MTKQKVKSLWSTVKYEHPDHLTIIQVGAFYETYDEDAEFLASEFQLRKYIRGNCTVVGFPAIALEKYVLEIGSIRSLVVVSETGWNGNRKKREVKLVKTIASRDTPQVDPAMTQEEQLQEFISQRNLTTLFHFTHISNLGSILSHGIMTRKSLEELEFPFRSSDPDRIDGIIDSISVSLSTPNYWLFSRKQVEFNNELIVLELSTSVLNYYPFIAFPSNAARSDLKKLRETEPEEFEGVTALRNLFMNDELRIEKSISPSEPTDIQSEIMIVKNLPQAVITRIHIHKDHYANLVQEEVYGPLLGSIEGLLHINCDCRFFEPRSNERHDGRKFHIGWRDENGQ
jgi:hypothetical protein